MKREIKIHNNLIMRKLIFIILISFIVHGIAFSQGTNFQYTPQKIYISFALQPAQTTILNRGVYNSSNLKNSPDLTLNGTVEIGFKLLKNLSLSTGIGKRSYSTTLGMAKYNNSYDTIDSENDSFEMRIIGSGILEKQKITYLSVPVKINFQFLFTKKIGAFISSGIMVSIPVSKSYTGSGIFDYNGYYPDYNITLYDLPQYGFPGNVNLNKTDKLDITSYNLSFLASAGLIYWLNPIVGISLGLYYDQSLSSISNYKPENYQLTRQSDQYNTLMSSTSDVWLKAIGTSLAVHFYLK
jgi:hypothetical protein